MSQVAACKIRIVVNSSSRSCIAACRSAARSVQIKAEDDACITEKHCIGMHLKQKQLNVYSDFRRSCSASKECPFVMAYSVTMKPCWRSQPQP